MHEQKEAQARKRSLYDLSSLEALSRRDRDCSPAAFRPPAVAPDETMLQTQPIPSFNSGGLQVSGEHTLKMTKEATGTIKPPQENPYMETDGPKDLNGMQLAHVAAA